VQKGSLDLPALVHAPIEKFLISYLCRTSITPHQLTIAWIVLACATTILFALGHLIWGIVLALVVGILDGLDGKQARIKVETSKSGTLEHRFDSLFEVAWPSALAYHFSTWLCSSWRRRSMALANWAFTDHPRNCLLNPARSIESSVWSAGGAIFMSGSLWLALFWACRKRR
jgi:hypothetical protein